MNWKLVIVAAMVLVASGVSQADVVLENFESYADTNELLQVWKERNPNAQLYLCTTQSKDGTQCVRYEPNCAQSPYWTEMYTIFPENQDWTGYHTLKIWVKGSGESNQSRENMYLVIYTTQPGVPNPTDHNGLSMLGKTHFYNATKDPNWRCWNADLSFNFETLSNVRAIGIGMSPESYGRVIHGMYIDALALSEEEYGGIIDNFEGYSDLNEPRILGNIGEGNSTNTQISLEVNDFNNIYDGQRSLKVAFNNGIDPYWAKVWFVPPKTLKYNWSPFVSSGGGNYNPLTLHFKVVEPAGRIQVVLIGADGLPKGTYRYNDGNSVPAGDWIRWDIDPTTAYNPGGMYDELDYIKRVEVQFIANEPNENRAGLVYLDNFYVNVCGQGVSGVGDLDLDLNDDCVVNFDDFATFAEYWQVTGCSAGNSWCQGADINKDGRVNSVDAYDGLAEWLKCNLLFEGDCF